MLDITRRGPAMAMHSYIYILEFVKFSQAVESNRDNFIAMYGHYVAVLQFVHKVLIFFYNYEKISQESFQCR